MRLLTWIFNLALFLLALGFAVSNTAITELHFLPVGKDAVWSAPLVIFLLVFFAVGVVIGLLVTVPTYFRNRREISRLRKEIKLALRAQSAPAERPADMAIPPVSLGG